MIFTMWLKHRELIWSFIKRELIGRYRGSYMGFFWSFVNPLFLLIIYTIIFSKILQVRFGGSTSPALYGVYLLCGMVPWFAFSETVAQSATLVRGHINLVKKTIFPLEILSVVSTLTSFIHSLFSIGVLFATIIIIEKGIPPTVIFLPLVMTVQILFTMGLSWFLASLGVFILDIAEIIRLLLIPWMFLTPIFYPVAMIPERFRGVMVLNPMAVIVNNYRLVLLEGHSPEWGSLLLVTLFSVILAIVGYLWFMKTKKAFADVI